MTPKFKIREELRSVGNFEKVIIERIDVSVINSGTAKENTNICYWNDLDKKSGCRMGHNEDWLTNLDCTNSLLKAKQLIAQNKFAIKIFIEDAEENKLVEESLKNKIKYKLIEHIDECIKNIIN